MAATGGGGRSGIWSEMRGKFRRGRGTTSLVITRAIKTWISHARQRTNEREREAPTASPLTSQWSRSPTGSLARPAASGWPPNVRERKRPIPLCCCDSVCSRAEKCSGMSDQCRYLRHTRRSTGATAALDTALTTYCILPACSGGRAVAWPRGHRRRFT